MTYTCPSWPYYSKWVWAYDEANRKPTLSSPMPQVLKALLLCFRRANNLHGWIEKDTLGNPTWHVTWQLGDPAKKMAVSIRGHPCINEGCSVATFDFRKEGKNKMPSTLHQIVITGEVWLAIRTAGALASSCYILFCWSHFNLTWGCSWGYWWLKSWW